jgi:hypothetical protein
MPYEIVKVPTVPMGFLVKKKQLGRPVYFSKSPMTKEMATRQLRALYANEK